MQDNVAEYFASFGLLRRDEALAKNYLTGNYGTILALQPMKMLKGRTADGKQGESGRKESCCRQKVQ